MVQPLTAGQATSAPQVRVFRDFLSAEEGTHLIETVCNPCCLGRKRHGTYLDSLQLCSCSRQSKQPWRARGFLKQDGTTAVIPGRTSTEIGLRRNHTEVCGGIHTDHAAVRLLTYHSVLIVVSYVHTQVVECIARRIADLVGVQEAVCGPFNVLRYQVGQHFAVHHDWGERVPRTHTALLYLCVTATC